MADELLPYYEKELAFIRQLGAEFAQEHPKIASRLGINSETIEDPHVSRLIESVAYLNARIHHKLDDDFPELSDALLTVLFPHYQRPIPSMSIVQFMPDEEKLDAVYRVEKNTLLETEQFQGENCQFTTIYPVELMPIKVKAASLMGRPFNTPGSSSAKGAGGVIKIALSTFNEDISLTEIQPDTLRFHLKGQPQHINPLYQLLLKDVSNVVIAASEDDTNPVYLGPDVIESVGFNTDEGMLPYPNNSFLGYRLLTEFFIFPEKFLFIDITGLAGKLPENATNELYIYIYVSGSDVELEHNINETTFVTGCTPIVNLFEHKADPIKLDHTRNEYQVVPDTRRPLGFEVYSVDQVTATTPSGDKSDFLPLYGLNHEHHDSESHAFWYARRQHAKLGIYNRDDGTDIFLNLVDLHFNPNVPEDRTLIIRTTCSNRDLPAKLPYSSTQPKLQCSDISPPVTGIRCLVQPTPTIRPPMRNFARWRLISHLSLNYLSVAGGEDATNALREILRLYDFKETSVTNALIDSILSVNAHPISAPLNIDGRATMCRGIEVEITIDDSQLAGSSAFLFASILEHFFALYCPINSFTRTLVKSNNKEGYLKKCRPRAGEKALL